MNSNLLPWILILTFTCSPLFAEDSTTTPNADAGYRIEQPGTITFTVGIKIEGKVAKSLGPLTRPEVGMWEESNPKG